MTNPTFIDYNELYKILYKKYKATEDEIRYWIASKFPHSISHIIHDLSGYILNIQTQKAIIDGIHPFLSDLPQIDSVKPLVNPFVILNPILSDLPNIDSIPQWVNPFVILNPSLHFYCQQLVDAFIPTPFNRFVYIKDLAGQRNWPSHLPSETPYHSSFPALDKAAENGLLRFYDRETDKFTFRQRSKCEFPFKDKLWIETQEGQDCISNPNSFFLLQDIINIERIFFNRPRSECLKELGFNPKDYE